MMLLDRTATVEINTGIARMMNKTRSHVLCVAVVLEKCRCSIRCGVYGNYVQRLDEGPTHLRGDLLHSAKHDRAISDEAG